MAGYPAVLLLLFSAACATATPPPPQVATTKPAATTATTPAPKAASTPPAPPGVKTPVPQTPRKDAAPVAARPKPVAPATAPTLDVEALKARLRATKAIGVFTKISLKNKVDDLMQQFTEHYQGKKPPMAELRLSYDLLMMKVLTLLQDSDPPLASAIVSSREAIWTLLANEQSFAALQS